MSSCSATRLQPAATVLVINGTASAAQLIAAELACALPLAPVMLHADCGRSAIAMLRSTSTDLVLADLNSLFDLAQPAEEAVARIVRHAGEALTVVLAQGASVTSTLAIMGAGAHECLARPIENGNLGPLILELARRHSKAGALSGVPAEVAPRPELADALAQMQHAYQQMSRLSRPQAGSTIQVRQERRAVLPMWQQEQRIIEDAITSYGGNIALAAAALEISPSTIYRKRQSWSEAETCPDRSLQASQGIEVHG